MPRLTPRLVRVSAVNECDLGVSAFLTRGLLRDRSRHIVIQTRTDKLGKRNDCRLLIRSTRGTFIIAGKSSDMLKKQRRIFRFSCHRRHEDEYKEYVKSLPIWYARKVLMLRVKDDTPCFTFTTCPISYSRVSLGADLSRASWLFL